jgi:hypothetical protein
MLGVDRPISWHAFESMQSPADFSVAEKKLIDNLYQLQLRLLGLKIGFT